MAKKIITTDLATADLDAIQEEIEATFTERVKNAREEGIRAHWETGEILERHAGGERGKLSALVHQVASRKVQGLSERTIWFCVKLHQKYGDFEKVYGTEHGQNVTVNRLKQLIAGPKPMPTEPSMEELALKLYEKHGQERIEKLIVCLQKIIKADEAS